VAGNEEGVTMRQTLCRYALVPIVAIAAFHCGTAAAAPPTAPSEAAKAMAEGDWEFSNADRDKRCAITFTTNPAPSGMKVEFDKECANIFPFVKEIAAWSFSSNDFLRMVDAKGKPVLEFTEVEAGLYEAPRPGEGILFVQAAAAVGPPPREPEQIAGDWGLVRGSGKPICTLTLANRPAANDLELIVKPGCDAFVTQFAPTSWQMDRGELILKNARNQAWRFAEGDNSNTFERVPEGPQPILLIKQ